MSIRVLLLASVCATSLAVSPYARGTVDARLLRDPAVSETHIAFVYAGDIWVVRKTGGTAQRLSSPPGEESQPQFSPDGRRIVFTGNYDGNPDLYVIDATGGPVTRASHHPAADRALGWYPKSGSILFASTMQSGSGRFNQLYTVNPSGGLPERLPIPYAEMAALSADEQWVAFTFTGRQRSWKRYRGGTAPDLWLFNLQTLESRNITQNAATDDTPMWRGQTLYFLSDRGEAQRFNLWAYSLSDHTVRQVTHFLDTDVRSASIGPADIVFEASGRLHLLDLANEEHHALEIDVVTDLSTLKPEIKRVGDQIQDASLSPSGKRIVMEARGDLFSVPAEHGPVINLTQSSGVAERFPALSPDGKSLAYWTDRNGEYELAVRPAEKPGAERIVLSPGPGFRYHLFWSPDSAKVAFIDQAQKIWICTIADGKLIEADQARSWLHGALQGFRADWSADSRWLTWSRLLDNGNLALFVFDTASGERHQLTAGFYSDYHPVFAPNGKHLYFQTERAMNAVYGSLDREMWTYVNSTRLAALPLRPDVASPLRPRNDSETADGTKDEKKEEGKPGQTDAPEKKEVDQADAATATATEEKPSEDSKKEEAKKEQDKDKSKDKKPAPVEIDFADIERRVILLPPDAGNYGEMTATEDFLFYVRLPNAGSGQSESKLLAFDFKERKEETVLDNVNAFALSADRKKLLVNRGPQWAVVDAKKGQKFEKPLRVSELEMKVDPRAEWRQIFDESWRLYRDFFYDPALHGIDWPGLRERYGRLLQDTVTRWDVNYVVNELISEVNASHVRTGGGDTEESKRAGVGMLGIDWSVDKGAYRIKSIVRAAPWDAENRSPLAEPGINASAGDYILAVNHMPLDTAVDPWAAFAGLEGQTVLLTINENPSSEGARDILVKTMTWNEEAELRHDAWVEANRKRVAEASKGTIGYIYMPNTAGAGQDNLMRQFKAQQDLPALIIDERFNAGGQLANRFLELLARKPFAYLATRHGPDDRSPAVAHFGPQVMLINGWAGSGGDALPWYFKTAKRGPILGVRTWGGLVGPAMGHRLIDGGGITVPPMRLYDPEGKWFAEGHGVEPDIEVVEDPSALARGTDVQLERAIQEAQRLLQDPGRFHPPATPAPEIR